MSLIPKKTVCEEQCMQLDLGEPPEDVLAFAREHQGETEEKKTCAVHELRELIYSSDEVIPHRMDDAYLIRFLRARFFNVEKAHQLMIRYYKFKTDNPGIQEGVDYFNEGFQHICKEDIISVLPYRDHLGRRTMIYRLGNWNPSQHAIDQLFQTSLLLLELAILEQRAQILGGVCFFDLEHLSMQQAWQFTPSIASKVMQLMGVSFPIRIQEIHILNQPWLFDMIFGIFKPMLHERTISKIHFHGSNFEKLHTFIDPKNLPKRYGGSREDFSNLEWVETLDQVPEIIAELESLGYNCSNSSVHKKKTGEIIDKDRQVTQDGEAVLQS